MDILSSVNMAGNRMRNLPAAAANDEPVRKDQVVGGVAGTGGIQIQDEGSNLGTPDVTILNFVGGSVAATRGTGTDASKVTVTLTAAAGFQYQDEGANLGAADVTVLDFVGPLFAATRGTGPTANVVTLTGVAQTAVQTAIADAGNYFGVDNVEAALQQLAAAIASVPTGPNYVIGPNAPSSPTVGLGWFNTLLAAEFRYFPSGNWVQVTR